MPQNNSFSLLSKIWLAQHLPRKLFYANVQKKCCRRNIWQSRGKLVAHSLFAWNVQIYWNRHWNQKIQRNSCIVASNQAVRSFLRLVLRPRHYLWGRCTGNLGRLCTSTQLFRLLIFWVTSGFHKQPGLILHIFLITFFCINFRFLTVHESAFLTILLVTFLFIFYLVSLQKYSITGSS